LPLLIKAFLAAFAIPEQQGTSMRKTVRLLILLFSKIAVSFSE
jgi:hypothetical protein